MNYVQTNRILAIDTRLGPDKVVLTRLEGEDALSRPFLFRITIATEEPVEAVKDLLGTEVTLYFGRPGETDSGPIGIERRPLHGVIHRLMQTRTAVHAATEWSAEVVPALWFLSRTTDCRIFQEKSVPDIVREILDLHGVKNYRFALIGSYPPLGYCVQYRETALDFISRLMEMVGIFFWHEHEQGRHVLVIGDDNGATRMTDIPEIPITGRHDNNTIRRLDEAFEVRPGKWTMRDYNFETPSTDLEVSEPTTIGVKRMESLERYDYPGLYMKKDMGRDLARLQIEQEEAAFQLRHGESGLALLDAGTRIKVAGIADPENVIVSVRHRAVDYSHWSDRAGPSQELAEPSYDNEFTCIPKRVKFRPQPVTPRPIVQGPQTAVVTGPPGEEIHTDKYARVKVQFHWDRLGRKNENSSCWVRVSQSWAGSGYGFIQIPRIGQEVIVDFLEGDPDRPIITGRVYNAEQMPPHGLPGAAVKSGLKSNSTKGGGGSNELTFDDTKGKEQTYFHSQYNHVAVIENNETRTIVTGNRKIEVKTGTHTEDIKSDTKVTVISGIYEHKVSEKTALRSSKQQNKLTSTDADVLITAKTQIKLEVGDSSITMLADGTITIKGKNISILGEESVVASGKKVHNLGGEEAKIGVGNQNTVYDKQKAATSGAAISSAAVGQHEITGAIVKIN